MTLGFLGSSLSRVAPLIFINFFDGEICHVLVILP